MTIEAKLKEIRERAETATGGPWSVHTIESLENWFKIVGFNCDNVCESQVWSNPDGAISDLCKKDFDFIAHARQDIPMLLTALEQAVWALNCYADDGREVLTEGSIAQEALGEIERTLSGEGG